MFLAQFVGGGVKFNEVGVLVEVDIHAQSATLNLRYKSRKNVTTIIIILFI